jgi:hypothetical protein
MVSATTPAAPISSSNASDSCHRPALAHALMAELKLIVSAGTWHACMRRNNVRDFSHAATLAHASMALLNRVARPNPLTVVLLT